MADDPDDRNGQQGGARNGRTPKLRIEDDGPDEAVDDVDELEDVDDPDNELGDGLSRVTD